jgi:protein O-mannosyl-transferase
LNSWRGNAVLIGGLGAMVLLAYANSFHCGLVIDNQALILGDPRLREVSLDNLRLIFTKEYWWPTAGVGVYRPLATLSYWFNYAVLGNGTNPFGYHCVNFLLEWLDAALVFLLFARLFEERTSAFFGAALFALHPIATECVTNVVGRTDLLVAASVLAALLCYIRSVESSGRRRTWWLVAMSLAAALGLFSKENAVAVVVVIVLYDLVFRRRQLHEIWRAVAALAPVYLAFLATRTWVFAHSVPSEFPFVDNPLVGADFGTARLTAVKALGRYLWLLAWPQKLSCDYSYNEILVRVWDGQTFASLVVLAAIAVVAAVAFRRNKALFFLIAFSFVTMLPTSNLIVLIGNIMGERYVYLSLIGFAGCVALAGQALLKRRRAVLAAMVIAYGARTFVRNFDWVDEVHIWRSAMAVCPNSFKTHKSYAKSLHELDPQRTNIDTVIAIAERGLAIMEQKPLPLAWQNHGIYADLGAYYVEKAEALARTGAPAAPRATLYQLGIGFLNHAAAIEQAVSKELAAKLAQQGRSVRELEGIGDYHIHAALGVAYLRLGLYEQSSAAFTRMQRLAPGEPNGYFGAGLAHAGLGRTSEAAVCLLQASLLDNNNQEFSRNLFEFYATHYSASNAVIVVGGQRRLNLQSPLVHEQICEAYRRLVLNFRAAEMDAAAKRASEAARKECGWNGG